MKKISRKDLQALRRQFPVLTEFEMRGCVGGNNANTSWDCLFNCMHYMDPSRSTQDYYNEFVDRYNYDPKSTGGVFSNNEGDALETFGFKNVSTNSMKNSKDYHYVIILDNNDGTSHAVIATSIPVEDGTFSYYDRNKVEGSDTAIMPGTYKVVECKYKGESGYYEVSGVEGRTAIKIHNGKTGEHTSGCFLPGVSGARNSSTGEYEVYDSRTKLSELTNFLNQYGKGGITMSVTV